MPDRLYFAILISGLSVVAQPALAQSAVAPLAIAPARASALASAQAALVRLGIPAAQVKVRIIPAPQSTYRVRISGNQIEVEGSSPVAVVHGITQVLQKQGRMAVSWEGNRLGSLRGLRLVDTGQVSSPFAMRNYLNTCTFGYTTPWWNWGRWSREIDWMAARGIDAPLAMEGQEYIWAELWREQGLDRNAVAAGLSAAPFLPWQRMGNIAGYRAPLSSSWIEKKHLLQKRILTRMRELGMKPILPAFSGYVPEAFARAHPEARIYRMREWEGFPATYWLDPSDPLFAKLARRFIVLYTQAYGPGEYYLADAFNEMVPPIAEDGSDARAATYGDSTANTAAARALALPAEVRDPRLAAYGERLYDSIAKSAPGATWVMQGWLFGADKAFWTPEAIRAFLSRVPRDRMLILDIGNDRYPGVWNRTQAFDGKNWTYGYVHNYGGSNPVYGDLDFYRRDIGAALASSARGNLTGFGMFPEGLHNNSIVYAYAYDLAWGEDTRRPMSDWLGEYLAARYGSASPDLRTAWERVIRGTYSTAYWTPRWWRDQAGAYLLFKRPSAGGADYDPAPGDRAALRAGLDGLLAAAPRAPSALFDQDLVDIARHYATLELDGRLQAAIRAYDAGRLAEGDAAAAKVTSLATMIDDLIGTQQETLGSWIGDARAYASTRAERDRFTVDAKAIVTVWGGEGHLSDYASRAWQGLYVGYYLPRWQMFLAARRRATAEGAPFDDAATATVIKTWEQRWLTDGRTWQRRRPADPLAIIHKLLAEIDRP